MKAVGYRHNLPITDARALEDVELPTPAYGPRDLLVRVKAISVNPVDTKIRQGRKPADGQVEVLGWDAVGVVEAVGSGVTLFAPGDRVYYAGAINRPGTNAELHAVDERIVARAPRSLDDAAAAALPLTAITAYELLFDRLRVPRGGGAGQTLLVVGGAGGVGSILIQLARQLTQLRIVATASRPETRQWCLELGAHAVIDHRQPLSTALRAAGIHQVDAVAALTRTGEHFAEIVESLKPQGAMAVIDDEPLDVMQLKLKSISLHWELMFTRPLFETPDMDEQGRLLAEVAALVDAGRIRSTVNHRLGTINAGNLRRAHALIESGKAQGKVVLAGF
ncbi:MULTISPECIES: zinc-binding alcohol dehydrogenase family protein [unclassified Pseudoxanthomonas]|jgi:zinc-binding alcohol dehydrogenase family protein|uniref:zinc-binding alcohol dehydrogenase family protein n=1 Tax=unclassified Pseudoxanthomonas TaxID=2645906 RepID=UPI0003FB5612|nr:MULTISPECIES: zinc-binding alcohol dehydrogenase family protein [unclassified Pseudoxanthomonas]